MKAAECLLLLGGNQGDRLRALRNALKDLARLPGANIRSVSRVYETAPVGPSRRPYLNAVVKLTVALSPMALLTECKRLEWRAGRRPGRRWAARPLDIDILDYGKMRFKNQWLTIPHPRLWQRPFALAPLCDVASGYRYRSPVTAAAKLRGFNAGASSVRIYRDGL